MSDSVTTDIDLSRDLGTIYRDRIIRLGYDAKDLNDPDEVVRAYLRVVRRLVSLRPRKVLKSKEFACSPNHFRGLANIEKAIRTGGDLTPYLSKRITKRECMDQLLFHWRISHLHLGAEKESSGFVERTGQLVFCRFDENYAYLIAILPHGVWTKKELLTILHENWPDSIEKFRLCGVEGDSLEEEEIQVLRNKNYNHCVEMRDGTVYAPLGGGVSCSGDNISDVYEADFVMSWARQMQEKVFVEFEEIKERAGRRGIRFADPAQIKLCIEDNTFFAIEVNSGYRLPLAYP